MASILNQLSDDDREALNHLVRRDASTDAEIWKWAVERLPRKNAKNAKAGAGAMVVKRYRDGKEFKRWLARWENQDAALKKAIELQKQRFEFLSNLVSDPGAKGMETVSKALQARLLTLAAEASDEELVEGSGKNGWIKNVIRVVQEQGRADAQTKAEELKAGIGALGEAGEKVDTKTVIDKVDEIMGLKK